MEWFDRAKTAIGKLTELGIALLALTIVLQVLLGSGAPFLGTDVAANIVGFIKGLGNNGLVGLIAIGVVLYILNRR